MARIRSLKPEFWDDERFAECSSRTRLTFLGLMSALADDEGRMRGHPRLVRATVYAYDDGVTIADVEDDLRTLERLGRIVRYKVNGESYIEVRNFKRHQKIDRPSTSKLPAPPPAADAPPTPPDAGDDDDSTRARRGLDEGSLLEGDLGEGVGEGSKEPVNPPRDESDDESDDDALPEGDARERSLRLRIPPMYWMDLSALLSARPTTARRSWCADLNALLDGMHGPVVAPDKLGEALRDFVANGGANPDAPIRLFKNGYVRRVLQPPTPVGAGPPRFPSRATAGADGFANALLGVDVLLGGDS